MTQEMVSKGIEHLNTAFMMKKSISPLTEITPTLTIDDAYAIQLNRIQTSINNGDIVTGKKIGLTSVAMQNLLGVDQPDYGHLLKSMVVKNRGVAYINQLFQPKVEGEIAFVLKEDLIGPNVTATDVLHATDYIVASIEIVDSRIKDWKIKLEDTVADNASCGLYVLGDSKYRIENVNLKDITMQLFKNGSLVNEGRGTDVLGDPAQCVAWLANKLHQYEVSLKAGEVILSGALSAAVEAKPGDTFTAKFSQLGTVEVHFA